MVEKMIRILLMNCGGYKKYPYYCPIGWKKYAIVIDRNISILHIYDLIFNSEIGQLLIMEIVFVKECLS